MKRFVPPLSFLFVFLYGFFPVGFGMAEENISTLMLDMRHTTLHPPVPKCELDLPFATEPNRSRSYHDAKYDWGGPATQADTFTLTFDCDKPEAIGTVTLYFHSGDGWYNQGLNLPRRQIEPSQTNKPGRWATEDGRTAFRIRVPKGGFRTEEKPGPWSDVDTIRFSFWRGKAVDANVRIRELAAVATPSTVLVLVDPEDKRTAEGFARRLQTLGLETLTMPQDQVAPETLARHNIAVLPLNSRLPEQATDELCKYVERGGKVVVFYLAPVRLMQTLGFEPGTYLRSPEGEAAFAEVRFESRNDTPLEKGWQEVFGTDCSFVQRSWNIVTAKPQPDTGTCIAAWWYDAAGRKTEHPALLVGKRGAFFSHILTGEDYEGQNRFLMKLLTHYDPEIWPDLALKAWEALFEVGDTRNRTEEQSRELEKRFLARLKADGFDGVHPNLFTVRGIRDYDSRDFEKMLPVLQKMRVEEVRRYCEAAKPKTPEFRAWWEHAGTGAYPGDWDRTMRELAGNGYTAVIPNLFWGGLAHYESEFLPSSATFRKHGDQVAQCVAAGKKHGVEVHAWKVCYNLLNAPKEFVEKMRDAGRTQVKADGTVVDWLCPSHPENLDLEVNTFREIAAKYELDGVHFDYIRYPGSDHCYCEGCRDRFAKDTGTKIARWPEDVRKPGPASEAYEQWRCDQISRLVERVHKEVKQVRPGIKVSAAVFSDNARQWVLQDWPYWIDKGWLDFICPMNYTSDLDRFEEMGRAQRERIRGRIPHYPGIGATATGLALGPDEVVAQIEIARKNGSEGFTIFNLSAGTIRTIPPMTALGATRVEPKPAKP